MSSRAPDVFDRILNAPPPSLEELAEHFPGYTFDTRGWGEDTEIEVVSLPPEMEAAANARRRAQDPPALPRLDLSAFRTPDTPQPALNFKPLATHPLYTPSPLGTANGNQRFFSNAAAAQFGCVDNFERVRDGLGQSSAEEKAEKRGQGPGRPRKEKENGTQAETRTGGKVKASFTGEDLITIARVAIDKNPFIAPHGQKLQAWQAVVDGLLALDNFGHKSISAASIQHKVEQLVAFKKDPNLPKHKNLGTLIGEGTSASITIGALLERLETQFDAAKDKSDDAKAKLKKKQDEDHDGGESIRNASMGTMGRANKRAHADEATATTDRETNPISTPAVRTPAASASLETLDSDDEDKKASKRRRLMDRRSASASNSDELIKLMKEENARRAAHDERFASTFEVFVDDSRAQKVEFTSLLKELVAHDRKDTA